MSLCSRLSLKTQLVAEAALAVREVGTVAMVELVGVAMAAAAWAATVG